MAVIDMSGVAEFDPFVVTWMPPAAYIIVAVWGYLARLNPQRRNRTLASYARKIDGPFDSVRTFFVFMGNATLLAVGMTGIALLVELSVWDATQTEQAVFRSEVSRIYDIDLSAKFELDSESVGVGTDADGKNVIFRYDEETGTLEFPGEW